MGIFKKRQYATVNIAKDETNSPNVPDGCWTKCNKCGKILYSKILQENNGICYHCHGYFRLGAYERIKTICDLDTFKELIQDYELCDDPIRKYRPSKYSGNTKVTIDINGKKIVYEEIRGKYSNEYTIYENELMIQDNEFVELVCPCGLVFGYIKFSENHYGVHVA